MTAASSLSSSLPENTQRFPLPVDGWEQSCGGRLKTPGKVGGQKLTAASSGKAHSAQPFAVRVPKFFHEGKKRKKPHKRWYSLVYAQWTPSGIGAVLPESL